MSALLVLRRSIVRHKFARLVLLTALVVIAVAAWPSNAAAQRRGPVRGRVVLVGGYYGFPRFVYYDPWFDPWYQWGGPYGPYAPYGPYRGYPYGMRDELTSSVRLEVTPRQTEVYVDGYRAGSVDDYDGFFQRLRLRPGEHEIVLYLNGYRTVRQQLYLNSRSDQKVHYTMVPLPSGETAEPRPVPPPEPPASDQPNQNPPQARPRGGPPQMPPGPRGPQGPPRELPGQQDARFGSVSIRVQPADADVLIDGERWSGPTSQDRLIVQLSEGRHHVDVRKDGFENYSSDVQIRRGETVTLNVSLLRRDLP
jgi:hypothetical protein